MSIFPKKTILGGKIFLHTSMHYKGNSRAVIVKTKIIDPLNNVKELFINEYFHFPKIMDNYIDDNTGYCKGHSGLIYAKYLRENLDQKNNLTTILERLTLATHDYFQINIKKKSPLGKYQIKSEFIIDGFNFYSGTEYSDVFFVEKLSIKQEEGITYIINESPETTSFRISFLDKQEQKEFVSEVNGNTESLIPENINTDDAFLIYAEDQKIIPLFDGATVYRNPSVKFLSKENTTIVNLNNNICYKLEGESHNLCVYLSGFRSKEKLLKKFKKNVYEELCQNDLICETKF